MNTLGRQLDTLRLVPRFPARIDAVSLCARLKAKGYDVTLRTIQRDLNQLAKDFPLASDASKPQGWWWKKDAAIIDIPGLSPQAALTFRMVEQHLKPLLPESTINVLQPWFDAAKNVLGHSGMHLGKWPDRVRVLPKGMPLLPPSIDPLIQSRVYDALLEERWLRIGYRARGDKSARFHEVNPLAVVQRDALIYLVGTVGRHTNPVLMLLHRMTSAELLDRAAVHIEGFDLDQFIAQGELNYRLGLPIQLVVEFSPDAAIVLLETPLSQDQTVEVLGDQWVRIRASIPDTRELKAWLLGFGADVRVVHPENLLSR